MAFGEDVIGIGKITETLAKVGLTIDKPRQIRAEAAAQADAVKMLAHAEVEAEIARTLGALEVQGISERAARRFVETEVRRQQNLESIVEKAENALPKQVSSKPVDPDWTARFVDKAKDTSDAAVQELWAKLLAGEVASPGTFSKRVIAAVGELDSRDARLFARLCQASVDGPIIVTWDDVEERFWPNFSELKHLDSIGLISHDTTGVAIKLNCPDRSRFRGIVIAYRGQRFTLHPADKVKPVKGRMEVKIGTVVLTETGKQFAQLVELRRDDEYLEALLQNFAGQGWRACCSLLL